MISSFLLPLHTCSQCSVSTFLSLFFSSRHFLLSSKHRRVASGSITRCQPPGAQHRRPRPLSAPRIPGGWVPRGPGGWRCINSGSEQSAAQSDSGHQHVHISQHGRVQTVQTQIPRDGEHQVRVPVCQPLPSVPPEPVQHRPAASGPG